MSEHTWRIIAQAMEYLGLEYEPIQYTGTQDDYWVGSFSEGGSVSEDGSTTTTFFLTGFTRSGWIVLQRAKDLVEKYFTHEGRSFTSDLGGKSTCIISYDTAYSIPKDDAQLKSIQINLTILEWKVR